MNLIDHLKGKSPWGKKRSGKWPAFRKQFLALHPKCEVCGGKKKLEAHHLQPFHDHPELELDMNNLLSLCEGTAFVNCHLFVGHLGNFKSFNINAPDDARTWYNKIVSRP